MTNKFYPLYISVLLTLIYSNGFGQEYYGNQPISTRDSSSFNEKYIKNRFFTGGGMGLSFGNVFYLNASPMLGYRFTEDLRGGIIVNYSYINERATNYSTSIYGGGAFANYTLYKGLYGLGEYNAINIEVYNGSSFERVWIPRLYFGAGYRQMLGKYSFYSLEVLWNVLQNNSIGNQNPTIRGGIGIGL